MTQRAVVTRAEEGYDPAWGLLPLTDGSGNGQYGDCVQPRQLPPEEAELDYPIEPVPRGTINQRYRRQTVLLDRAEVPGSIIVDPSSRFLFHVRERNVAIRYGVGVGRDGFAWSGRAFIGKKRRWPRWVPTCEMAARDDNAALWVSGMPGGPGNPLGARALYLYSDGKDTLYRIHGTNQPASIGKAVSSGCIRMLNEDVADLYEHVPLGTTVTVISEGETLKSTVALPQKLPRVD